MQPTFMLTGASGQNYCYTLYLMEGNWLDKPGGYAFVRATQTALTSFSIGPLIYVGQTDSFQRRMPEHLSDKWSAAQRCGATHVLARVNEGGEAFRRAEENDLIARHQPVLNTQGILPQRNRLMDIGSPALVTEPVNRLVALGLQAPRKR